jgi:hypothetical protein
MALPPENKTPKVGGVKDAIEKMAPEEFGALPSIDEQDIRLFGFIIQNFGFIDLNLRRALEIFHLARLLPQEAAEKYPNLRDSELADVLIDIVQKLDTKLEPVATIVTWLQAIAQFGSTFCSEAVSKC